MYVVVQHRINDQQAAYARGARLIAGEGAPPGARALQFYPSTDGAIVTCLWEADTVTSVQEYVDLTLGDASENSSYEVDGSQAFAAQPSGLAASPAALAG